MKLNIGCGPHKAGGWVNTDRNAAFQPDVLASFELPFPDGSVERVYLGHLLEHLTYDDGAPRMLREILRVLQPGGELVVVGPDMVAAVERGEPQHILDAILSPQPEGAEDTGIYHQWLPTAEATLCSVMDVFPDAMIANLDHLKEQGWPLVSTVAWQVGVWAPRP